MHRPSTATTASLSPAVEAATDAAVRAIPPLWPLSSSVAVNPFLGQATEPLERAAARISRSAGVAITMSRSWYADRLATGALTEADLSDALAASDWKDRPASVALLRDAMYRPTISPTAVPTVAELAGAASGIDWPAIIAERIGHWAAGYFDAGQALWQAGRANGAYWSWRQTATHDLTPEILGLAGFAQFVAVAPETTRGAIARSTATLGIEAAALEGASARLLTTLGGWAQYARFHQFEAELGGGKDDTPLDLLAIRLLWEEMLFDRYGKQIALDWRDACATHALPIVPSDDQRIDAILQHAAELGAQRVLARQLSLSGSAPAEIPTLQAAFCIDVRSERFRRAMEATDTAVQTFGFAGFFGIATAHRRFASDVVEKRLPVLINPALTSVTVNAEQGAAERAQRVRARAIRAWGRFKLAAVSSFAFVEATGPLYLLKLARDALGLGHRQTVDPRPMFDPPLSVGARTEAAANILSAMSLTAGFARLVLIVGHGAHVTNNPHASALQCGACGGFSGDVNARLLVDLLNDSDVRAALAKRGVVIPADTVFLAGLHDTTCDTVTLYDTESVPASHRGDLARATAVLDQAGQMASAERAADLPRAGIGTAVRSRAHDWAETRPEWGLAGARYFIAAPRWRSADTSLDGQAFLHDYDCRADDGFGVLEAILTAPVVVASWISLQYYGSAVAPSLFGGGNKLLHNVTGGMGVVEGNGGALRGGLPWQSVHDGKRFRHDPLRLTVCVEAPGFAIDAILARHDHVRALFDNGWMHLLAIDEDGELNRRVGHTRWTRVSDSRVAVASRDRVSGDELITVHRV